MHIEIDELADAAAGVLEDGRTRAVAQHVDGCPACRQTWSAIADVSRRLAAEPAPAMPPEVARRLTDVVAAESQNRAAADTPPPGGSWHKPSFGVFSPALPHRSPTRTAGSILAACGAAAAVGFGGFLVSATAGLNEPTATTPAAINSSRLAAQAHALRRATDIDPHLFSKAWRCARKVTPGRITGLTPATVDGRPALLVYSTTKGPGQDAALVTVVTGCAGGVPTAGPSTTVPR